MTQLPHLVVVGVGALGSHVVLFGRNLPARLTVVDFDRVEQRNTASQFHTRMGVGRNKAKAVQQGLFGLFGHKIEAVPHKLVDDNVDALLGPADVVVDCVDHGPTRHLIQRWTAEHGMPCLHGALAADGAYARVMWRERFEVDDGGDGEATCEDGEHLPFVVSVAAALTGVLQSFLADGTRHDLHLHPLGLRRV